MPNWVHGTAASANGDLNIPLVLTLANTAGNTLILSVGIYTHLFDRDWKRNQITDTQGNAWIPVCMTPTQIGGGGLAEMVMIYTFAVLNCKGGPNTITVQPNTSTVFSSATLDEYSGVASVHAIDQTTFDSTVLGSGLNTISSGSIPVTAGEMLYSVAFSQSDVGLSTYLATPGFIQREYTSLVYPVYTVNISMASFDQLSPTPGSHSNTVTSSFVPLSIHVALVSLSPVPIPSPVVQLTWNSIADMSDLSATFPYPNTAGDTLILAYQGENQSNLTISDTQNNTWVVVYGGGSVANYLFAYCLHCKPGPNTVTVTAGFHSGVSLVQELIVTEYIPMLAFTSSNSNNTLLGSTVDTGQVGVGSPPNYLMSMFFTDDSEPPVGSNPGIKRFQVSEPGYHTQFPGTLVVADQYETVAGNYSNLFTANHLGTNKFAAIMGFTIAPAPVAKGAKPHVFSVMFPIQRNIAHLVYDIHGKAWYPDQFQGPDLLMRYYVVQEDPAADTLVLAGDAVGNVLVESPNTGDNGQPISCVVGTREHCPSGWAYSWFENPGVDLLPTNASPLNVQATSLGSLLGVPTAFQGSTRITQGIIDTGGGQPLKSQGLKFLWTQTYGVGEVSPVVLYMMQWLAVRYPEPILNQRTKGTSHGLSGFQHLYQGQLAYVSPGGPVTITLNFDQPGGSGATATIVLPATAAVGPDPIKQVFKIPPNKWKIASYEISGQTQFFLWPEDCEMWLKEWGSSGEYQVVRPWGGAEGGPIA